MRPGPRPRPPPERAANGRLQRKSAGRRTVSFPEPRSAPGSRRSLLLLPLLLLFLLLLPPTPAASLPPRLRLEAPLSFLRRRSRRCRCLGVGARGSRAAGDPTGRAGGARPRPPPPPAHHAALCHLSRPQAKILSMMEDNKQLALRIDGAVQSASQEVTNLRAELTATNRRLAELSGGGGPGPGPGAAAAAADSAAANMETHQHGAQGRDRPAPGAEGRRASGTRAGGGRRLGVSTPRAKSPCIVAP